MTNVTRTYYSSCDYGMGFVERIDNTVGLPDWRAGFTLYMEEDLFPTEIDVYCNLVFQFEDFAIEAQNVMLKQHYQREEEAQDAHTAVQSLWDKLRFLRAP